MEYYLIVSTIMMFVGIYGFVTRRNLLAMLISVELILNSVDINFVVFNRFLFPGQLEGFFFALFAIGISAAETAVSIAIIINFYRNLRHLVFLLLDDKCKASNAFHISIIFPVINDKSIWVCILAHNLGCRNHLYAHLSVTVRFLCRN